MKRPRISHATVVAYLALSVALGGTAYSATGGTFILGQSNKASQETTLTNKKGAALALKSKAGAPSLRVNRTVKVPNLNADLLDGVDSTALQRRVSGSCDAGRFVTGISAAGAPVCKAFLPNLRLVTLELNSVPGPRNGAVVWCGDGERIVSGGWEDRNPGDELRAVEDHPVVNWQDENLYPDHIGDDGWSLGVEESAASPLSIIVYALCMS